MSSKELIITACEKGDLPQLKRVLEETELDVGSEPLGSEGETALHVACAHGHLDIVQYLVNDRGCSVAVPNSRAAGATPLEVAWANKHWEVVEFLLKAIQEKELFAEVGLAHTTVTQLQEAAKYGDEALHQACIHGYLETVKFLTCSDYMSQTVSFHGTTPLQVAWENKHWKVASYLLQAMRKCCGQVHAGLSPTVIIQLLEMVAFGEDAFHVACSRGDLEVVRYLHESLKCSLTQQNAQGETPLDVARLNGHLYVIHFLLESAKCSAPDMTELHIACMGRDEERVKNLASDISSLGTPDQYGITAVHYATFQPEILSILVSIAKQKNMLSLLVRQDERGNTPLHYATSCGFTRSVTFLIPYYESVNMQNSDGDTPLHLSIKSSYCSFGPVREILLHESCNPSTVNAQNETVLHIASQHGKLDSAELLLSTGKCNQEDIKEAIESSHLLHQAVATGRPELVQVLLNVPGCNINVFNSDGETPFHVACKTCKMRHSKAILEKLVEDSRCNLNAQTQYGDTALHLALCSKQEAAEKVQCILQSERCNPNITNSEGYTPLHLALKNEDFETLLKRGDHSHLFGTFEFPTQNTPLHQTICTSYTPLQMTTIKILPSSVESLLNHKNIDLNIQSREGNTPLHEAVMRQVPVDVVAALTLHNSCNPSIANNTGMTPLQISGDTEELNYAEVLITSGKCSHEDIVKATEGTLLLHQAVLSNIFILFSILMEVLECNVNITNSAGDTALHVACRTNCSKVLLKKLVVDGRCDLNAQNNCRNTALHLAIHSETEVVWKVQCILQSKRCNPNITNSEGYTPLHVAVRRKEYTSAEILLKHSKCNPSIQDFRGNTPLHMAIISNTSLSNVEPFLHHKHSDPNIQNIQGNTPLHEAVMRWAPIDVVEALVFHKACNPSIVNNAGLTPLNISADFGEVPYAEALLSSGKCSHEDIVKATEGNLLLHKAVSLNKPTLVSRLLMIQEWNINETNSAGETALHVGCKMKCSKAILEKLVEDCRCDLNAQNHHGNTALHIAIYSGTEVAEKVQCILQSERCNPNITNSEGHTPLHVAVSKMEFDASVIILKHSQCNPNIQDITGNTPLHLSIRKMLLCNIEPFLVHDKINLDIQNQHGETILHKAVKGETSVDVVKALIHHKSCSLSIANDAGITPLQSAIDLKKMRHVEVLITSGKCSHEDIVMAARNKLLPFQAVALQQVNLFLALIKLPECNTVSNGETLLHVACRARYCKTILESIVENSRCDLNAQNVSGDTALHIAVSSEYNNTEKVKCILKSERCNPNITNRKGFTPLYVAVQNKRLQSTAMLLEHSNCNPNIQDSRGNTPLHFSIVNMSLSTIKLFLMNRYIDLSIQNNAGDTVLHVAILRRRPLDVVRALICHKSCNPCTVNSQGMTPLQVAVGSQQMDITAALVTSNKCDREDIVKATKDAPLLFYAVLQQKAELLTALIKAGINLNASNSKGETALHKACEEGNYITTELLLQSGADVLAVDWKGNAPIHVACAHMALKCLGLLLGHDACNPNQQNAVGDTPLHILCSFGQSCDMRMLHTLLCAPGIDPECVNRAGQIPAELAKSNYSVIEMIFKYLENKNTQLETYLKIFVVGNSGGGKSTLIKAVTTKRSKYSFRGKYINPSEVPPHTAGIVPLSFKSQHFGHAVLYDFAGQHEYYSSHAAVMENLVLPSPPLFLLLIDISKPMDEIREELVYWWMFINNHSKRATAPPHVILVGSHKDIVKERRGNVRRTMEQITDIVRDIPVSFQFDCHKPFPLDCRKLVSQGLTVLLTQLKLICQTLRQTADIDLHCHILKAFLTTNFHSSIACEVSEITENMKSGDELLPREPSQLIHLLSTLSDKGYILLLQNHTDVNKSWVVLKPEVLLTEVNGSIFAPDNFKEHCSEFAMSTGVVPLSKIIEKFGEPNNQVIIRYLTHLEFCFRIKDQHTLEMITKDATLMTHGSEHAEEFYFFPALIQNENPSDVCQPQETIKYECGWFYRCNEPTEQLTTRFLHVLILRLAFSCDPPDEPTERESVVLLRSCSVWKHGIAWWTNDGIETIVEVGLQCHWVAVMLRCPDTRKVQCAELRTKVINTVLKTKQDFCPAIGMKEFLIAPSSLQYPFEGKNLLLYNMREIARVVMKGDEYPKNTKGKSAIQISQLLPFEPFFGFENLIDSFFAPDQREISLTKPNFIKMANICHEKLDDFKKALKPDPFAFQRECVKSDSTEVDRCVALFQIIQRRGCKTWRDFEQEFSKFSIFCGRHPVVSLML